MTKATSFISRAAKIKDTVSDLQKKVVKDLCESYPEAEGGIIFREAGEIAWIRDIMMEFASFLN